MSFTTMFQNTFLLTIFLSGNLAYLVSHSNHSSCCALLSQSLHSKISYPSNGFYDQSLYSYWSEREQDIQPNCIFRPTSDTDVSTAIKLLSSQPQCKFAIRGGGHLGWPGSANIQEGITFDLTSLSHIIVSHDKTTTTIGGGAYWNQVYTHLDSLDLNVAGGRYATVGVGGLTLGGGISFFSPRYGFVADTVDSFDLVMADGRLETISSTNKPDLFRALKGGSNNFGILTAVRLRTFPGGPFFAGTVAYDTSQTPVLARAFMKLAATSKEDFDSYSAFLQQHVWTKSPLKGIDSYINNLLVYTKPHPPDNSTPNFLLPLQNAAEPLKNKTDLGVQHLSTFLEKFLDEDENVPRRVLSNLSFRVDDGRSDYMEKLIKIMTKAINHLLANLDHMEMTLVFQPIHPIFTSKAKGSNVLGFGNNGPNLVNLCIQSKWNGAQNDEFVVKTIRDAINKGQELAKEMGVGSDWLYLNYSEEWQDPISGYGVEEVKFLRKVSRKYDPKGVFQRQVPGGFKIWDGGR